MLFRQTNCKLPTFREVYICIFKLYHDKEVSKKSVYSLLANYFPSPNSFKEQRGEISQTRNAQEQ